MAGGVQQVGGARQSRYVICCCWRPLCNPLNIHKVAAKAGDSNALTRAEQMTPISQPGLSQDHVGEDLLRMTKQRHCRNGEGR